MNSSQSLTAVKELLGRLEVLEINGALDSEWPIQVEIIKNDVDELADRAFAPKSRDWKLLIEALHPGAQSMYGTAWQIFWQDFGNEMRKALSVVAYRLEKGQAELAETAPDSHLVQAGQPHDGYILLRDIVETTTGDIMFVDNWIDRELFVLLSNLQPSVTIRFLTMQKYLPTDFIPEAKKFSKQYGLPVQVRIVPDIHDRFLVIDGRAYHSGASFKDWGKKTSVVSELKDTAAITISHLETQWNGASVLM